MLTLIKTAALVPVTCWTSSRYLGLVSRFQLVSAQLGWIHLRCGEIGDQGWFAENLRTTSYQWRSNPCDLTDDDWISTNTGATAVYGEGCCDCYNYSPDIDACDEAQSLAEYGRLYNWYAVDDARACVLWDGMCRPMKSGWYWKWSWA